MQDVDTLGYTTKQTPNYKFPAGEFDYVKGNFKTDPYADGDWQESKVWNNKHQNEDTDIPAVAVLTNKNLGGVIVKQSNNKAVAKAAGEAPKATWTDMIMSTVRKTFGAGNAKNLKWMVRDKIDDETTTTSDGVDINTPQAITAVYKKLGLNEATDVLELDPESTDPDQAAAWEMMASQTHISRVLSFLVDFKKELDYLKVKKITILPKDNDFAPEASDAIFIEFGRD
jgi:hypothetical protein